MHLLCSGDLKEEMSVQENIAASLEASGAPGREPQVHWQVHPGHPWMVIGADPEVTASPVY